MSSSKFHAVVTGSDRGKHRLCWYEVQEFGPRGACVRVVCRFPTVRLYTDDAGARLARQKREADVVAAALSCMDPTDGRTDNPFAYHNALGWPMQVVDVATRLERVKRFDADQCERALKVDGLQKTVRTAIERRLRQLRASA